MPTVWIPSLLRDLTGGQSQVTVPGATVGQVIAALEHNFPGMRDRLCDGGSLRSGIAVAVGPHLATRGLLQPVADTEEVHFITAVSGG